MKQVKTPLRTCVVCRAKTEKRELIRVVRTPTGRIEVDTTGKRPGRGVYLCHREACWDGALKKNRLDHSLKVPLSTEDRLALREFAQQVAETSIQR